MSIKGEYKKRPDLVLYVNGLALGIVELKNSRSDVAKGIRQNLDNQKKTFIRGFFTTAQLVMAGNDSQGLRYGTIETPEKYYLSWKEENPEYNPRVEDARLVIITDRTELDQQIEGVFLGIDEHIYRTKSGADLVHTLNDTKPWLICSLVHKFGHREARSGDDFVVDLQRQLPANFSAKGEIFVFVDECHRTQSESGKLHGAMKKILPGATFIGFTGTPLLKQDKQKSIEAFGSYIHTYKFDEAVADKVVLDLRYEARDIDQTLTSQKKIDQWFEAKTSGLSRLALSQLKQKWGTLQKISSSQSRLQQIVTDILLDMDIRPRLMDGRGNAMLVVKSDYSLSMV